MSITLTPTKARYLEQVRMELSDLPEDEREEIVQDLEAHLAELEDGGIEGDLGDAEAFAAEFRRSAGLDEPANRQVWEALPRMWNWLEGSALRIAQLVRWPSIRPIWIWVRGWLVICAWALLYTGESFRRFPIPVIENSTWAGLFSVVAVTAISVWLDRSPLTRWRRFGTTTYSFVAAWALLAMLVNPVPVNSEVEAWYPSFDRLTTADGEAITNIFAYDLEGNAVEVLLYDQDGQPLLTFNSYVYEEDMSDSGELPINEGVATLQTDQFGRPVPNLYPLQMSTYDDYGRLTPMAPPSLGFPTFNSDSSTQDLGGGVTLK